ncbi:MAG: hypothetical protein JXR77_00910, partial [Lentisphaeria bacterium]|nr:hypothetical protein [Lentisphaeria bacterium]
RDILEAFPNLPNPPSPFLAALAPKMVLDIWSFGSRFSDTSRYLEALKGYGVDELAIIFHVWQRHGYDNALPEHLPANPGLGGEEEMRELGATARRLGYLFSLHENYIDYYPNYPHYTDKAVAVDSRGHPIPAWYMPSTGLQSFRLKPTWIDRYVTDQSPQIHARYGTTAAYLDVHSTSLPWHMDFEAGVEGAASMRHALATVTDLFRSMREIHGGPLFGEGNYHAVWAGRIDGCEAQVGGRGGEIRPLLVDFDLLKVHPLAVNHGMGYYSRWHRERSGRPNDQDLTKYRAQELAYGHAAFLNTGIMDNLTQALREYYLVQPIQARYGAALPRRIEYQFDGGAPGRWVSANVACRNHAPRRLHTAYDNGLELWINDDRGPWDVEGQRLPAYGFLARGAGVTAWTALRNGACVADFAETPERLFVDPRTCQGMYSDRTSVVAIRPLLPELVQTADREFRITYRFDVSERLPKAYITFVHFTDAENRILWQNDHRAATPTSEWPPGQVYGDGPHTVSVPDRFGPGTYDIRVGLFLPGQGRLALDGRDGRGNSYSVGQLRVSSAGGGLALTLEPPPEGPGSLLEGRNPAATVVDFGPLRSSVALRIDKGTREWRAMPIPHGYAGQVSIDLRALDPGVTQAGGEVTALAADGREIGPLPVRREGSWIHFNTTTGEARCYRVRSRP